MTRFMYFYPKAITVLLSLFFTLQTSYAQESDRIPFYEDFLKDSNLKGFLKEARKFLETKPEAIESPRLSMDYLMAAKAARDIEAISFATSQLLFRYSNSLPTLHFISSFEKGSNTLTELLIAKADTGNLESKEFAVIYCRALIMIAQGHGPEFLANPSLRLRAYLLATKAEVQEITKSASKALALDANRNNDGAQVFKIVLSESTAIEKLSQLSNLSSNDAKFATAYYLAQLTKEDRTSGDVLLIQLKQALFNQPKNVEKALSTIARLPSKIGKQAKIQTFLGLAHYFDGNLDLALKTLSNISKSSNEGEMQKWENTAQSLANGLQFVDSRKKLFLEAVERAISQLNQGHDSIFLELSWSNQKQGTSQYTAFLCASKEQKLFEILLKQDAKTIFAYRADHQNTALFSSELNSTISFKSSGAIPVPNFDIQRDVDTGGFNFKFNLNFAPDSDQLIAEGIKFLENPYISTNKGREVLLSYFLNQRAIWLLPSGPVNGGQAHFISQLNPDQPEVKEMAIIFDLRNNLKSLEIGDFSLSNLSLGDASLLKNIPDWPSTKSEQAEKFDFQLLLKIIKKVSDLIGS